MRAMDGSCHLYQGFAFVTRLHIHSVPGTCFADLLAHIVMNHGKTFVSLTSGHIFFQEIFFVLAQTRNEIQSKFYFVLEKYN